MSKDNAKKTNKDIEIVQPPFSLLFKQPLGQIDVVQVITDSNHDVVDRKRIFRAYLPDPVVEISFVDIQRKKVDLDRIRRKGQIIVLVLFVRILRIEHRQKSFAESEDVMIEILFVQALIFVENIIMDRFQFRDLVFSILDKLVGGK